MSTILVTGGMGAIGSWVTRQLLERGDRVVVYQRHRDDLLLRDIRDDFTFVGGDVLDLPALIYTIRQHKVERILHLSSLLIPALESNPFLYKVNVDGSINIFEAARLTGVGRVVYTSTKGVYGKAAGEYAHPTYKPIDEEYPKAPATVYGATKLFVENMGLSYQRIYGLDFVALRFASPYGPGRQVRHGAVSVTSKIIESGMLGKPLKIPQGGDQRDDLVYHRDVAASIVLACFADNLEHRIFHIGTGRAETLRHMAEIVNRLAGKGLIEVGPGTGTISWSNYSIFDIERARRELGYTPHYDLEAGIRDYMGTMTRLGITPSIP